MTSQEFLKEQVVWMARVGCSERIGCVYRISEHYIRQSICAAH